MSRSVATIERGALAHNLAQLRSCIGPKTSLCAVVKADGYGHGAGEVARVAVAAGAGWLAVAHAQEGAELRAGGLEVPILLLSEPVDATEVGLAVTNELRVTVYSEAVIDALAATHAPVTVHLKVDTGMRRVGADPDDIVALARRIQAARSLELEGLWTHCAVADEPGNSFTATQLQRFEAVSARLSSAGIEVPLRHAANSAACMAHPQSRYDMVRAGIALYGVAPAAVLERFLELRPVLRWTSQVSLVKRVRAGEAISYGHHHRLGADGWVATVPVGYADGLSRRWGQVGGAVLIGGRRRPIVGAVTMDQVLVDCGADDLVVRGDEVVVLGAQGDQIVSVQDVAQATDTIVYEVLTAIGPRVARRYR